MKKLRPLFYYFLLLPLFSTAQEMSSNDYTSILDTATIGTEAYFQAYEFFLEANKYAGVTMNIDSLTDDYIKTAKQFNKPNYQSRGMYIKAQVLADNNDYNASLQLLQEALDISKSISEHKISAKILSYTGIIHAYATEQYAEGVLFIEKSNVICEAHSLEKQLSINYYFMGYLYTGIYELQAINPSLQQTPKFQNYLVKAVDSFDKALKIAEEGKDSTQVHFILSQKVNLFFNQKKYKETIDIATIILNKAQLKNDLNDSYKMHIVLAKAQFALTNKKVAYEHLDTAIQIIEGLGATGDLIHAYYVKHDLAFQEQDYKTALDYYVKKDKLKDSIWTAEKQLAFDELKISYETEQKEQQNLLLTNEKRALEVRNKWISGAAIMAILGLSTFAFLFIKIRKQNVIINHQRIAVSQSLQEKEVLLKEIHHRVKNNLQIISNLMAKQARKTTDETVKKMMQEGQDRVQSMALIHQNLYQSDNISGIDMKAYLEELTNNIARTQAVADKEIAVQLAVDDSKLDIDTAIPLGLILNEVITNAFKYAFPTKEGGKIAITFQQIKDKNFLLAVKDNGIGLPTDFNLGKTKSLGLNLVRGLVQQLDGEMKLVGSEKGTQFELMF